MAAFLDLNAHYVTVRGTTEEAEADADEVPVTEAELEVQVAAVLARTTPLANVFLATADGAEDAASGLKASASPATRLF